MMHPKQRFLKETGKDPGEWHDHSPIYHPDYVKWLESHSRRAWELEAALESFPDMDDGRISPERLHEAAREWWWAEMWPVLQKHKKALRNAKQEG